MKLVNTCSRLQQCLLLCKKAVTEPALLGSVTKSFGLLIWKMGTTLALPIPPKKEECV